MDKKISVIIPVYNSEKTLNQCLDSLTNQTIKDFEAVIVDNNSTDKTKEIIFDFIKRYPTIIYAFEKEKGRGAARNTGEKIAKGEIILMTDSDCILPEDWIEKMIKPIINREAEAVQGSEEDIIKNYWTRQLQMRKNEKRIRQREEIIGSLDTKNLAILKTTLEKIGFSNRKYSGGNDLGLSIELSKQKTSVKFINIKVKHYHPDSFLSVIKKQFYNAYWCKKITNDNKYYLIGHDFLNKTHQTPHSFFYFISDLPSTILSEDLSYVFFSITCGIAWRMGLIFFILSESIKNI